MDYDVTIIGAGPVGSIAAEVLANDGYKVLILEEHPTVGLPQHCTGKISVNALRELNLKPIGTLQEIRGATFYSPNMKSFTIKSNITQAYILDRQIFDSWLSDRSVKAGAKLITNARATNISTSSLGTNINFKCGNNSQNIASRVAVAADGANSSVAHWLGLYSKESASVKMGVQREVKGIRDIEQDVVELYFGRKYAPGFFAWIVPTRADEARVGLCVNVHSDKPALKYLDEFIHNHPIVREKLKGCLLEEPTAHLIPTGGPIRDTVYDGIIIAGDAAGQVKSTTGGGLYYGMLCAMLAGKTLSKALANSKNGVILKEALVEYERSWRRKLGGEIAFSVKARSFMDSLTDDEVAYLFNILREDDSLMDSIVKEGDLDWQSSVTRPIVKHLLKKVAMRPSVLYKLGKSFL